MSMSTLKETSTTKSSRQGSLSHQQLSFHIPMVMLWKCPVASYLPLWLVRLSSYVEINVYSYYYITCLLCQCCSESATKCNLRVSIFKIFQGTPLALHAVHNHITMIWKSLISWSLLYNLNMTTQILVATALYWASIF